MVPNQSRVIELLREVHLITFREIKSLNLRIAELETQVQRSTATKENPSAKSPAMASRQPSEVLDEKQVAAYVNVSLATVRRWRLLRTGPKFVKIGALVRYRRTDLEDWLRSCANEE